MDLQKAAEAETERRTRSKLEEHRRAIMALRAKKWTYRQIAKWLNEHGIAVTPSSVYRFCERSIARRPRAAGSQADNPFPGLEDQTPSGPTTKTIQTTKSRFDECPL
jgi:IS30 family transposase